MDWRKTKTIFIITFLILNIFLGYQIFKKIENSRLDILKEASTEEQFEADEITFNELPKEPVKASYISGKSYNFTEEDIKDLEKEQLIEFHDDTTIKGKWKEPLTLPENNLSTRLNQIVRDHILFGSQYEFWGYNQESNTLVFFQKYDGNFIYSNPNGSVVFYLNDLNQIISYEQTYIDEVEEMDEDQEIISAFQALENLYNQGELKPGSNVPKVKFGYYKLYQPFETNSHVLTPTWHIIINDTEDFFVNAIEGQIINKETRILE